MSALDFLYADAAPKSPVMPGLMAQPKAASSMPMASHRTRLSGRDRAFVNAVAAYQLRYARPEEALALLQVSNRLWPDDRQTLRLLTQAFLAIGDFEAAEMTETAFARASGPVRASRLDHLRKAFIHFGRMRLTDARTALGEFMRLTTETRA